MADFKKNKNYIVIKATRVNKLRRLTAEAIASVGEDFLWLDKNEKTFFDTIKTILTLGIIDSRTNVIYFK